MSERELIRKRAQNYAVQQIIARYRDEYNEIYHKRMLEVDPNFKPRPGPLQMQHEPDLVDPTKCWKCEKPYPCRAARRRLGITLMQRANTLLHKPNPNDPEECAHCKDNYPCKLARRRNAAKSVAE